MSRVERKEYQETKVMKSMSPVRQGSSQNVSQFDNNLDYLLEDLQSSVPRSNGTTNTYRETRVTRNVEPDRSHSLNRVTHLKAANPVTEYSTDEYNYTSPDGSRNVKGYKKESYSYSSTGDNRNRMQNNINQLDSLLDDLKQAKNQGSNNNVGIDPGLLEPSRSRVSTSKRTVERELHYGDTPPRSSSRPRTVEKRDRDDSLTRQIEYTEEGTYGETRPVRYTPSPQPQSTLTKQKQVTNVHTYPLEVSETTTPEINPEILANLDPNLLPAGNTKVTTTIKTYTYEIPGSGYQSSGGVPEPEKLVYSPNQSQTTPSKSFVYNKVESNDVTNYASPPPPQQNYSSNVYKETSTVHHNAPPYQKPTPPGGSTTLVKETTRNYQPGYQNYPDSPPGKQTYIYNESTTTKTINDNYPGEPQYIREVPSREPPRNETYIIRESHNTTTDKTAGSPYPYRSPNDYPPQEPGRTTVIYKQDTHTTNTTGSPYPPYHNQPNGYPPQEPGTTTVVYEHDARHINNYTGTPPRQQNPPNTTVIYKTETNADNYNYPPHSGHPSDPPQSGPRYPNEPPYQPNNVNITYKYTTHTTSSNKSGYPPNDESLPLMKPHPFPRDDGIDGPPKRVDQLMATIGDEPPDSPLNHGFSAHEVDLIRQKKVDALKQQQQQREGEELQKKERNLPPTKNISGPPVYYPPGQEMFARKEESGGGWRAEGAMARESGRYMYESESGSKMKVKSGAAVVPVCLPLCCGLPCTII